MYTSVYVLILSIPSSSRVKATQRLLHGLWRNWFCDPVSFDGQERPALMASRRRFVLSFTGRRIPVRHYACWRTFLAWHATVKKIRLARAFTGHRKPTARGVSSWKFRPGCGRWSFPYSVIESGGNVFFETEQLYKDGRTIFSENTLIIYSQDIERVASISVRRIFVFNRTASSYEYSRFERSSDIKWKLLMLTR